MSGPALLHNMPVPPVSMILVSTPGLAGRTFCTTFPRYWKGYGPRKPPAPDELEAAFAGMGIPDLVGVFTLTGGDREAEASFDYPLALAILARRSGNLYLPWRPVYPALVPRGPLFLVFPEEGG